MGLLIGIVSIKNIKKYIYFSLFFKLLAQPEKKYIVTQLSHLFVYQRIIQITNLNKTHHN